MTEEIKETVLQPLTTKEAKAKSNALIAYGLMAFGSVIIITWFIGAIWAMVKKSEAAGTRFEDHYKNIIQLFWYSLVLIIIGFVTSLFVIGYFILLATWVWIIFRLVKGFARILTDQSYS
ncbi:hypothetical protein LDJ79_21895 [Vibrio tritonius]|uniref:Transmembrane protein n=1 Tax=Vibrio tritonius TaxID=1435069 RepID=A0ABS7YSX0_9VIBR|nr:hypothetical protein [Vibrio tritonius]MCA2018783.1 hypothetical protein [Vibrio tritonius]